MEFLSQKYIFTSLFIISAVVGYEPDFKIPLFGAMSATGDCFSMNKEYPLLKSLVHLISTRITFAKDVALYKWIHGKPILDEYREAMILQNVSNMAKDLSVPYWPHLSLFFQDLMEATKLLEYILISEWYFSSVNESSVFKPSAKYVDLNETRKTLNNMQEDIIKTFSEVKGIRGAKMCDKLLSQVFRECNYANRITFRALQRAFGTFCITHVVHIDYSHNLKM